MFRFRLKKSDLATILFIMVACLVGRNFVANVTFAAVNAKPRACAISHNQIDVCKEISKKQGVQQPVDATVAVLYIQPPGIIDTFQVDLALIDYNNKEISAVSPPRAPPLLSCEYPPRVLPLTSC